MTNTGNNNSGDLNSGYRNVGSRNSGQYNSGNHNLGHNNSGHLNSGNHNSGLYNSGCGNTGNSNDGYRNTGNGNLGNNNTGNYNSGDFCTGHFNTFETPIRMFNKPTNFYRGLIVIPYIEIMQNYWVNWIDLTNDEKQLHLNAKVNGGLLKTRSYQDAWRVAWQNASKDMRRLFLDLPNFDADIFEQITGVNVNAETRVKLQIDEKIVYISKESAIALGLIENGK